MVLLQVCAVLVAVVACVCPCALGGGVKGVVVGLLVWWWGCWIGTWSCDAVVSVRGCRVGGGWVVKHDYVNMPPPLGVHTVCICVSFIHLFISHFCQLFFYISCY